MVVRRYLKFFSYFTKYSVTSNLSQFIKSITDIKMINHVDVRKNYTEIPRIYFFFRN